METDTQIKLAIYRHFAEDGRRPSVDEVTGRVEFWDPKSDSFG